MRDSMGHRIMDFINELGLGRDVNIPQLYGVAYAANHSTEPKPYPIIAKSICDFADSRKSDQYQRFAAYTSCEFTKFLCEKILPEEL